MQHSATLDPSHPSAQVEPELSRHELGFRVLYSCFLCLVLQVVSAALGLVFFYQILYSFLSQRRPDARVTDFGEMLARYLYEIFRYLTFNRSKAPFPFSDWRESSGGRSPDA